MHGRQPKCNSRNAWPPAKMQRLNRPIPGAPQLARTWTHHKYFRTAVDTYDTSKLNTVTEGDTLSTFTAIHNHCDRKASKIVYY